MSANLYKIQWLINFLWFFFLTLESYYFYQISMSIFPVLSAFLAIFLILIYNKRIPIKKYYKTPLFILAYVVLSSTLTALPNSGYFYDQRLVLILLLIPIIIYSTFLLNEKKRMMLSVIKVTIIIHLIFFFSQFITFYATGGAMFLDFLEPITGESQRALGGSYTIGGQKLIRSTGLFNEPGTYSNYMFIIFLVYKGLKKEVKGVDSLSLFDFVFIASILLTFSVFGFLFTLIFLFRYFIKEKFFNKIVMMFAVSPFLYISINEYLLERFSRGENEGGLTFRENGIRIYFERVTDDLFHLLFGYSGFIDINSLFGIRMHWNDIGFIFVILLSFGLIGLFLFIIISIPKLKQHFLIIIITCLSKISFTTIFLWFVISYIYGINSGKNINDKIVKNAN